MDADDLLDAWTSWAQYQSSGLCAGMGGDWGQTPWAYPLVLHASRKTCSYPAAHFLLVVVVLSVCVIGAEQSCFHLVATAP